MKNKKTHIILVLFLFISLLSKSQNKELIYIRIQESIMGMGIDSYIRIAYPDHSTKLISLVKLGKEGKDNEVNAKKIQFEITTLMNEGYQIQSCSVGSDISLSTTLFILTRNKDK